MRTPAIPVLITLLTLLRVGSAGAAAEPPLGVVSGATLPTGLGPYADPSVIGGFAGGLQGSLGLSSRARVFGYDDLTATLRWTPGNNWLGLRLSLMLGTASWYTPPLGSIYRAEVLSAEERGDSGSSVNTAMLGLSFRLFGVRDPQRNQAVWRQQRAALADYDLRLARLEPGEAARREHLLRERNDLLWSEVLRRILRTPTLVVGAMFRIGAVGNSTDAEAVDAFATFAGGRGIADVVLSFHYLRGLRDSLILTDSVRGIASLLLDLSSGAAPPVLGLMLGAGHSIYAPRSAQGASGDLIESAPRTTRIDAGLSISGAPDSAGTLSAGVGLRYGLLLHSEAPLEHQLLLCFTSGFRFAR